MKNKNDELLQKFEKTVKDWEVFIKKYEGSGIIKKIQRFWFSPDKYIYIPYLLSKYKILGPLLNIKLYRKRKLFWGKEILININDPMGCALGSRGILALSETKLTKFLIKNLRENDVFYDIGANHGFYTYLASEICKETHAFEPTPSLAKELRENLKNSPNVYVNQIAVSDKNGEVILNLYDDSGRNTIKNNVVNNHLIRKIKHKNEVKVQTITLDTYINTHSKPTFIKLDIEGAESDAIEGAKKFLQNNSPIISIEIVGEEKWSDSANNAVKKLITLNYAPYYITDTGEIKKIDKNYLPGMVKDGYENFIFKK